MGVLRRAPKKKFPGIAYKLDGSPVHQGKDINGHIWWDVDCSCDACYDDSMFERKTTQQKLHERYMAGDAEVGLLGEPTGKFDYYALFSKIDKSASESSAPLPEVQHPPAPEMMAPLKLMNQPSPAPEIPASFTPEVQQSYLESPIGPITQLLSDVVYEAVKGAIPPPEPLPYSDPVDYNDKFRQMEIEDRAERITVQQEIEKYKKQGENYQYYYGQNKHGFIEDHFGIDPFPTNHPSRGYGPDKVC